MNPAQLSAFFAAHKVAVLGAGAAGVVLLGLRARKKTTAGGTGAAGSTVTGGTAAAVVPANGLQATGSTYDSSAYDVYSALQSELTPFLQAQAAQTTGQSGITSVPPIASTLFAPTGSGQYALYGNGTVAEIQTDGSQLGLNSQQWSDLVGRGAKISQNLGTAAPDPSTAYYQTNTNLAAVKKPA